MKKNLFVRLLFSGSFLAQGQTLDLETCLKMADTANYSIRNSRLDVLINEKQKDAYMSARLPKLIFAGDYKYNAFTLDPNINMTAIPVRTQVWAADSLIRVKNQSPSGASDRPTMGRNGRW